MRLGFYAQMAWTGIRRNKQLYLPYILTCMGVVLMSYIIKFLSLSEILEDMAGGMTMKSLMEFGSDIMSFFSLIFLFYTSSFLNRRRDREFGLYNILGMGKKNLARILLWESVIMGVTTLAGGLAGGILLSKLAELAMINLIYGDVDFAFRFDVNAVVQTAEIFALIFIIIFIHNLWLMWRSNPIELLRSEHVGEKAPRANWGLALLGLLILAGAYYIALSITEPIAAVLWFFVAVAMVIAATYLLFVAGSVVLCRILQKNKNYYYKKQHFISVSSMVYRMKRNGAGLASICILSTMVLVMLSSTVSLYTGVEDTLRATYPRHIMVNAYSDGPEALNDQECIGDVRAAVDQMIADNGQTHENVLQYRMASALNYDDGEMLTADRSKWKDSGNYARTWEVYLVPLEDYNAMTGLQEELNPGEALIYTPLDSFERDTLNIEGRVSLDIVKEADVVGKLNVNGVIYDGSNIMYIFVPDFDELVERLDEAPQEEDGYNWTYSWRYGFDMECEDDVQREIYSELRSMDWTENTGFSEINVQSAAANRGDFYGVFGGLFFLGILLAIVFLFATVLIMYYKQVTEGYEDQSGFDIMQKVGMTKQDIRQSINSQVLTVFFAPLLMAGLHLIFASPIVYKIIMALSMNNNRQLFMLVTLGCFLMFAVFILWFIKSHPEPIIISSAEQKGVNADAVKNTDLVYHRAGFCVGRPCYISSVSHFCPLDGVGAAD